MTNTDAKRRNGGFTLIELMIVVAVLAIITTIAYPSYREHVLKSTRTVGKGMLVDIATRQEQFFLDNRRYTTDLSELGLGATAVAFDNQRSQVDAGSTRRVYLARVQGETTACPIRSCYVLEAVPQLGQAQDTNCGTLTLASNGARNATGSAPAQCW
jgi:type IV pilus assembly protein PilE